MTEYKKLSTIVDGIHSHQLQFKEWAALQKNHDEESSEGSHCVEEKYYLMKTVLSLIRDVFPRLYKLVMKGRERDPNRQIYNEKMCERINLLYTAYCQEVLQLWFYWSKESSEDFSYCYSTEDGAAYITYVKRIQSKLKELHISPSIIESALVSSRTNGSKLEPIAVSDAPAQITDIQTHTSDPLNYIPSFKEVVKILEDLLIAQHANAIEEFISLEDEIPFFIRLSNNYFSFIRKRSEKEDWERQTAASMSEIIELERSLRELVTADEYEEYRQLTKDHRDDRLQILLLIERKKVEKRQIEMDRRVKENQLLLDKMYELRIGDDRKTLSKYPDWRRLFSIVRSHISLSEALSLSLSGTDNQNREIRSEAPIADMDSETRRLRLKPPGCPLSHVEKISLTSYRRWLQHLFTLVKHIQKAPDDSNIRTLRANHQAFMEHFSHPSFVFYQLSSNQIGIGYDGVGETEGNTEIKSSSVGNETYSGAIQNKIQEKQEDDHGYRELPMCSCRLVLQYTELVLYAIGYRLRYDSWEESVKKRTLTKSISSGTPLTTTYGRSESHADGEYSHNKKSCLDTSLFLNYADLPFPSTHSTFYSSASIQSNKYEDGTTAGSSCAILPDFYFPCGRRATIHKYTPVGFEPYGERLYQLMEPNPEEDPDGWIIWFDTLNELHSLLVDLLAE